MSGRDASDQIKAGTRKRDMRTHLYDAEEQVGAKTWATEKAEKKNKEAMASGAATRRRAIPCPNALQVGGQDETGYGA